MITYNDVHHHLETIDQTHIVEEWSSLTREEQSLLSRQILDIDAETFKRMRKTLHFEEELPQDIRPLKKTLYSGSEEKRKIGESLIAKGKAGCLIMAGGMGTRLQFDGPKGMFPITQFQRKSLFQYFSERVLAASKKYGQDLPMVVMTSSLNDQQTRDFFHEHHFFGLKPSQVHFYVQGNLPFLDNQGNLFLDSKAHIAEGPDGNGELLHTFYDSGIWKELRGQGVEYLNVVLIDNPLADPFDAELIGTHSQESCDILVKGIERDDPKEKLGILVRIQDKVHVVEYSELPQKEMEATLPTGELKYPCGNLSLFSVKMAFIESIHEMNLPLHKAFKALPFLDQEGRTIKPSEPNGWKFEKFIFDVFPYGDVEVLLYPRKACFSPLKNAKGKDSPETVREALQEFDRRTYEAISGMAAPDRPFELDPKFSYPTEEITNRWKGKPLPETPYIRP